LQDLRHFWVLTVKPTKHVYHLSAVCKYLIMVGLNQGFSNCGQWTHRSPWRAASKNSPNS